MRSSCAPGSVVSQFRKTPIPASRSTPPDSYSASKTKKISPLSSSRRINSNVARKLNHKNWDVQITMPNAPSAAYQHQGDHEERDDFVMERNKRERSRFSKPEVRRALFGKNTDDKSHKFGGSKNGSRVVPCHEDSDDSVVVSNGAKDQNTNDKDSEDLSLIRNQLSEIEKQQSSLLDLLQVCHL